MEKSKIKLVLAVAVVALLVNSCVYAGDWLSTTTPTDEERFNLTAGTDVTEGGNISNMALSQEVQTGKWAAYYGNLTGSISLRNQAGTASVFNWVWSVAGDAEVCAIATASDFNWSSLANSTAADIDAIWGFAAGDTDSATNTFNITEDFDIAGSGTLTAPSFPTGPEASGDTFETGLLEDGDDAAEKDYAFCVNAQDDGTVYDNSTADYELMVPTNETAGQTETYYFYVELN